MTHVTAWCAAIALVVLVLVIGGWEPAPRMTQSTFQDERLPR